MGYGGDPGLGLATGGIGPGGAGAGLPGSHQFGSGQFGSVGNIPRLANTAMLDAVQALSPVSAVTVAGGVSKRPFFGPHNKNNHNGQVNGPCGARHVVSLSQQLRRNYLVSQFSIA